VTRAGASRFPETKTGDLPRRARTWVEILSTKRKKGKADGNEILQGHLHRTSQWERKEEEIMSIISL